LPAWRFHDAQPLASAGLAALLLALAALTALLTCRFAARSDDGRRPGRPEGVPAPS
jgi:hypothetical protein